MFAGALLLFLCPGEKASLRRQGKSGWRGRPWPRERGPSDTSYRVAKRSSDRSSARGPCPQVLQWHPRVAKGTSIGTLARGASTEALLGQGRVSKERESVPLTGLWSGSRPGLARHPRLQVVLRHPRVAKRTSIGTLAQGPRPQSPQSHPGVAKGASIGSLARPPCLQMPQWHPRVAKGAFVKAKGAVLGNIKCDEEGACLQLGCRLSSLFL